MHPRVHWFPLPAQRAHVHAVLGSNERTAAHGGRCMVGLPMIIAYTDVRLKAGFSKGSALSWWRLICSRSTYFWIFPDVVVGNAST